MEKRKPRYDLPIVQSAQTGHLIRTIPATKSERSDISVFCFSELFSLIKRERSFLIYLCPSLLQNSGMRPNGEAHVDIFNVDNRL